MAKITSSIRSGSGDHLIIENEVEDGAAEYSVGAQPTVLSKMQHRRQIEKYFEEKELRKYLEDFG